MCLQVRQCSAGLKSLASAQDVLNKITKENLLWKSILTFENFRVTISISVSNTAIYFQI